jgi:hypothetical protein
MVTAARRAGCARLTSTKIPELASESTFRLTSRLHEGDVPRLTIATLSHSVMSPATAEAVELARGMKDRKPRAPKLSSGNADWPLAANSGALD